MSVLFSSKDYLLRAGNPFFLFRIFEITKQIYLVECDIGDNHMKEGNG